KLTEGKDLIRYFCVPCNPTKVNGGRTRNLPHHAPTKWSAFKTYNSRDVEVEIAIQGKLSNFPVLDSVWKEYWLDQEINDRGIEIDKDFVEAAVQLDELSKAGLNQQLQELTGLENPNSVLQMRGWLLDHGLETESLGKKAVAELLEQPIDENLKQVLVLRQQLAKSSVKKYQAMQNFACSDNRSRGLFQFYGANRTGRFAGRGIQLQNLPQNHMSDLSEARSLVKQSNFEMLNILYGNVPNVLSELLRTAFVPREGMKFIVSDFSAIEARVIAWLSGEKWRQEVFKNGGDIYCASASQMFGVPVEKHGVNGHLRQKGKIAELALGYGGSVGALKAMDALEMGLTEDELQPLVNSWRDSNINITELWWAVDKAVKTCVKERRSTSTHGIKFEYKSGFLFIQLLSGRKLVYVKPKIGENKFGGEAVTYEGVGATKKWERLESYGPKFVENIVQAIARDILCFAMENLRKYRIVGHVHDEVIIEVPMESKVEDICQLMSQTPKWAEGLLLNADGYECEFYQKD
ncbi:DNA polymerase, partial [Listeria monocytogenes]|nr:DNA polymerase [Listeria monocytogenes]EJQ0732157.1 DNA polymerase [Listeria monocytogenes]HAM1685732.1 DNA polymerase [Listeria monocytogenes]HBZ6403014.1 DNA polymerase [Listeria monocytogenes]HDU7516546.1 DNA polymerase [Listeria monocytogenes]